MPYLETKKVPQNEKAVLLGINNLPEVLQKFLLQFLNFQEILGIFQLPALKARFYNMVYPLIHIAPFLKIERGPNYNIRPTDYCLSIDDADSNGMIHYVIRFQDRPLKPKQLLSKSVNWSDIKNEYKEEDPIAKKQQIEQYILNKNKEQIKKIVLREIPESSLHTFFTIMSVLYLNQSSDSFEVNFNNLQNTKELILDQEKLLKECRENIILAHLILKAPDPWMHKRLPYTERFSPNAWKFIVFGQSENLWNAAGILLGLSWVFTFLAFITLLTFQASDPLGIILSDSEKLFLLIGCVVFPPILQPLYYVILKFFATLIIDIPSTLQRAVEIYDNLLKLQANIPEPTFIDQEKDKISKFLNNKKTDLERQNGLFSFFNRTKVKALSVDNALTALQKVSSKEALANFMDKYLNDKTIASLHTDAPGSLRP